MPNASAQRLQQLLKPVVTMLDVDLEEVTLRKTGRRTLVVVIIDKDGGVNLDTVASVSRSVAEALDENDLLDDAPYVIEVTSPGVDRPLTVPRHWRRARGRLVKVTLTDGQNRIGRIASSDELTVDLEDLSGSHVIAFAQVQKAVVQVEFTRSDEES